MKFKTTPYHHDLLKDWQRLAVFYNAILDYDSDNKLAYDLGCGSGILSYFLSSYFEEVISLEIDYKTAEYAKENLSNFSNVHVINSDVMDHEFREKADLIVCEMMDTALIDEEQVPVLNYAKQFLKDTGKIIPMGVINTVELVNMEREYVHWDEEGANYEELSDAKVYSKINFLDDVDPDFENIISIKAKKDGMVNGLKITTFTVLIDDLICGPTPMLNPPLLIPLDKQSVKSNEFINVKLKYSMGNGIESIKTEYV
ncbi:methyltransferase domain-containing protein [Methanobrevibacter sp.]|uniref:methyltransferase domain-containing protein n=1 Tax=Methanobrevibacter sp. TaxID=66852 RepID=UPI0026E01425|nr:methyltransferase domain-containing protein [Methanobrevibacter sp.]MDO5860442.1 methyltransferase domain-containing protein [Methanobrevibacter sp.]